MIGTRVIARVLTALLTLGATLSSPTRRAALRHGRWTVVARGGGGDELNVVCTLRGKNYDVTATSVSDLQKAVEDQAGLEQTKQGVLFKGKMLDSDQMLADAGVAEGDTINIVPQKAKSTPAASAVPSTPASDEEEDASQGSDLFGDDAGGADSMLGGMGQGDIKQNIDALMGDLSGADGQLDPSKLQSMMSQFKDMYNNPMFKKVFEDPEMLEQGRKMILNNPMLMNMYEQMGMGEIVKDPEKYRNQMMQLKEMLDSKQGAGAMGLDNAVDNFDDGDL